MAFDINPTAATQAPGYGPTPAAKQRSLSQTMLLNFAGFVGQVGQTTVAIDGGAGLAAPGEMKWPAGTPEKPDGKKGKEDEGSGGMTFGGGGDKKRIFSMLKGRLGMDALRKAGITGPGDIPDEAAERIAAKLDDKDEENITTKDLNGILHEIAQAVEKAGGEKPADGDATAKKADTSDGKGDAEEVADGDGGDPETADTEDDEGG